MYYLHLRLVCLMVFAGTACTPTFEGGPPPTEASGIETVQMNWQLSSERPVEQRELLTYFQKPAQEGRINDVITRGHLNDPQPVVALLQAMPAASAPAPRDLRMVCLVSGGRGVDTLVIDREGRAQFAGKRFQITPHLAALLGIQSFVLNPEYAPGVGPWEGERSDWPPGLPKE